MVTTWNGLKRSPMKPGTKPLKQKPITKIMSARQKERNRVWAGVRLQKIHETDGHCEVCEKQEGYKLHAHHKLPRRYLNDTTSNCVVVCGDCHQMIHDNPLWAYENDYMVQGY